VLEIGKKLQVYKILLRFRGSDKNIVRRHKFVLVFCFLFVYCSLSYWGELYRLFLGFVLVFLVLVRNKE